jgi:hypothetical protein
LTPAKQVNGRWLLVLSVGAIIISLAFIGVAYVALSPAQGGTMFGTLFVNEGGYSNATASVTASYNVTLTARNGGGSILLTFLSGSDLIQEHLVSISNYTITINEISMNMNGHAVVIPWEDNDTVWAGQYNSNYIASWGPSAPAYELRGQVSPSVFGLPQSNYVEFRFQAAGGEPSDDCC